MVRAIEEIRACGHKNVISTHRTTFEITKEEDLSVSGNCIIAVGADKGSVDLSPEFRSILNESGSRLITRLICMDVEVEIISEGAPGITLTHQTDLVWRRSAYTCNRTIGIYSSHTASSLPRNLISHLQAEEDLLITLTAITPELRLSATLRDLFPDE